MGYDAEMAEEQFYDAGGYFKDGVAHLPDQGTARLMQENRSYFWDPARLTVHLEKEKEMFDPEFYERQAAEMLAKADALRGIPQSDTALPNGLVLTFTKLFTSVTEYDYSAIKAGDGYWYITGNRTPQKVTWEGLLDFIGIRNLASIKVVKESVPLKDYVAALEGYAVPERDVE